MREVFFSIMLIITTLAFGEFNYYEMELEHTFVAGDYSPKYIEPYLGPQTNNPASFYFDNDGNLFVADSTFRRIVKYDKDFNFIEDYKNMNSSTFDKIVKQGEYILASSYKTFSIENLLGERIFFLSVGRLSRELKTENFTKHFEYRDGVVYLSTKRGVMYQIKNPSPIREDNILEEINLEESAEIKSRTVVGDNIIDFSDLTYFYNYKEKIKNDNEVDSRSILKDLLKLSDLDLRSEEFLDYLSTDIDGNLYWCDENRNILVFSSNYQLIDAFTYNYDNCDTDPVVHPSGDVYFMGITNEEAKLLRVKRVW